MSRESRALLQTNPEIIDEARGDTPTARVSVAELTEVLSRYGLPPIRIVERRSVTTHDTVTGEEVINEYMPKYRIVFASQGTGEDLMGITSGNNFQPGETLTAKDKDERMQHIMRSVAGGLESIQ